MEFKPLPEKECEALLVELFLSIAELLQEVAPDGFQNSELFKVYHPTPEQQYKEYRFAQLRLSEVAKVF